MRRKPRPSSLPPSTVEDAQFLRALGHGVAMAAEAIRSERGPVASDWVTARDLITTFSDPHFDDVLLVARVEGGDVLHQVMYNLVFTLAVLAHQPGGVRLFGTHFEMADGQCVVTHALVTGAERKRTRWN